MSIRGVGRSFRDAVYRARGVLAQGAEGNQTNHDAIRVSLLCVLIGVAQTPSMSSLSAQNSAIWQLKWFAAYDLPDNLRIILFWDQKLMYFKPEAVPAEIPTQISKLIAITQWKPWERRFEWITEQIRVNPTMPNYILNRFGLELAFQEIRQHFKSSNRYPWPPKTAEQQRFYSFITMITRCHQRLSSTGKSRMSGMLKDALKSDYGLAPLVFEMKIVAHLMMREFKVNFHDMETGGGFDYLAIGDDMEFEVECKFVSGDIGRKIHQKEMHQLTTILRPKLVSALDQAHGSHLVQISIPGKLGKTANQHQEISCLISKAIIGKKEYEKNNEYKISVTEFSFDDSPFIKFPPADFSSGYIEQYLSDKFEIEGKNTVVLFHPEKGAIIVVVQSLKEDAVLKGIHRQLKGSANNQLTGERPGILCCELADLTEKQLLDLKENPGDGTGLQYMVTDLICRRAQIHTVAFTTPGTVRIQDSMLEPVEHTSIQETGPAYVFYNPDHPQANDLRYGVFK
jgi:hypothetical protein